MKATIYSKDYCPFCVRAKALLNKLGIQYDEFIISDSQDKTLEPHQQWASREDLISRAPDARTVPQIWLNNEHVGGYTELAARFKDQTNLAA